MGAQEALPRGARRDRRHRLGRQDQDHRTLGRSRPADGLRPDPVERGQDPQRQQPQRRRQPGRHRRPVGGGARRRPDPRRGRHQRHRADPGRRRAGSGQGHRHRHHRPPAAARHRRHERRGRHRPGHRPDAPRREEHALDRSREGGGRQDRGRGHPAAGREDRAHLRPRRPHRGDHPHRAAQHGGRHPADPRDPVAVPRQPALGADRRGDDSLRPVLRGRHPRGARRIGQPPLGRRARFRPHRRRHRHHGRGDLPAPLRPRHPGLSAAGARREIGAHRARGRRRQPLDLLRGGHHRHRLPAALHADRRRGPHLRADGDDLRLRPARRPDRHLHGHARARRLPAAGPYRGEGNDPRALPRPDLPSGGARGARRPPRDRGPRGARRRRRRGGRAQSGLGIPAQARGGQPLGPRHHAGDDLAQGEQRLRQRDAQDHRLAAGGRARGLPARSAG